jgi:hypothetical protein
MNIYSIWKLLQKYLIFVTFFITAIIIFIAVIIEI